MLVSDTHKFVLFHFPKTAGTSITEVLAPYLTPNIKIPTVKFMGWQPHHHYDLIFQLLIYIFYSCSKYFIHID